MADTKAIQAVCAAVVGVLQEQAASMGGPWGGLEFEVCQAPELTEKVSAGTEGVYLFLYRVAQDNLSRNHPGLVGRTPAPAAPQLQVELRFLLTIVARPADRQVALLGWLLKTLAAHPVLTTDELNRAVPGSFAEGETVELLSDPEGSAAALQIWKAALHMPYCLSVGFQARKINISL